MFSLEIKGQNLEYSRVILVDNINDTVPVGKVWKITNVLSQGMGTGYNDYIYVNGVYSLIYSFNGDGTTLLSGPIWLPEGTVLSAGMGVKYISVIEFSDQ